MSTNDGGPAFPVPGEPPVSTGDPRDGMGCGTPTLPGMSLRDYFAARVMQIHADNLLSLGISTASNYPEIAREAYGLADAMLAAREGKEPA